MQNIYEILARAAALRDETQLNSISPERAGGIMYDTLLALNDLWLQQGAALVISKIYASVAAMEADTAPVSDLTGQPLRPGQIVVIASSDSDNGSVYRYNGADSPSWSLVGEIGNLEPVDSLDSDSTQLPLAAHQGKVLDGKISQLGQKLIKLFAISDSRPAGISGGEYYYNSAHNKIYQINQQTTEAEEIPFYDGAIYTYNGVLYTYNGTSLEIASKTITDAINTEISDIKDEISKHFVKSENLLNLDNSTTGIVINASGAEVENSDYSTSEIIAVEPSAAYAYKKIKYVATYNSQGIFSYRRDVTANESGTFTIGSGDFYVRLCYKTEDAEQARFNKGTQVIDEEFSESPFLEDVNLAKVVDKTLTTENMAADAKATGDAIRDLFQNLKVNDEIWGNNRIAYLTGERQSDANCLSTNSYISKSWKKISVNNNGYEIAAYAYNDWDYYVGNWNGTEFTKTGGGATWFKSLDLSDFRDTNIRIAVRYVNGWSPIDTTTDANCLNIESYIFLTPKEVADRILFGEDVSMPYQMSNVPEWTAEVNSLQSSQLYAMWDALIANNGDYISKEVIANDGHGRNIIKYTLNAGGPTLGLSCKKPTIFITCGTHGTEKVSPVAIYLFAKAICDNWKTDNILSMFRNEVKFVIIGIVNPYGFDNLTRKNENGVDLNRNYPTGFKPGTNPSSEEYSGLSPLSENESLAVYDVLNAIKNEVDIAIDWHDLAREYIEGTNNVNWIVCNNRIGSHISLAYICRITNLFKSEFSWLPQGANDYYGWGSYDGGNPNGLTNEQFYAFGIRLSYTFESITSFWGTETPAAASQEMACMDSNHRKIVIDGFVNFLLLNLYELTKSYKYYE